MEKVDVLAGPHSSSPQPRELKGLRQQSDLTQDWEELGSQRGVGGHQASAQPLTDKASVSSHQSETTETALEEGIHTVCPDQWAWGPWLVGGVRSQDRQLDCVGIAWTSLNTSHVLFTTSDREKTFRELGFCFPNLAQVFLANLH